MIKLELQDLIKSLSSIVRTAHGINTKFMTRDALPCLLELFSILSKERSAAACFHVVDEESGEAKHC